MDYGNLFCVVLPKRKLYWLRSWMSQINYIQLWNNNDSNQSHTTR